MKRKIGICLLLLGIIMAAAIFWFSQKPEEEAVSAGNTEVVDWDTELEEEDNGSTGEGILIPGYGKVYMEAGQNVLPMSIGNPKDNTCYFKVKVLLEDGTLLYQSGILPPGKGVKEITCEEILETGEYNATAQFECFQDEEGKIALNGADSAFTLIVQ